MLRKIKTFFMNLPLRGKLLVLFLFASVIPLLFVSFYSYSVTERQLVSQTHENMHSMNSQINNNIENRLETYKQISSLLYMDTTLKEYLSQTYDKSIEFVEAYDYINDLLYGVMAANADIHAITLYPYNETIPSDGLFVKHVDERLRSQSWYEKLSKSYGDAIYSIVNSDEAIFTLARLLNNHRLQYPYGILTIDIKENVLYSLYEKETLNKDIYIINADGIVLSAKNKEQISKPLSSLIGSGPWENGNVGTFETDIDGAQSLIVFNSMKFGWKTVSVVPLSLVLSDVQQATNRMLLISGLSVVLAVALIFLTSRYFSNRFQTLYRYIRKVENEDFIFDVQGWGRDEVGQLAEAFHSMRRRLNELINEVYKKEILKKEAELYALQSQINPHFLYNTLSIISSLALRNHDPEVGRVVSHLSNFYKTSLNKGKKNILVQKELEITRHYIAIQQTRFENLFHVHWQIDESLYPYLTLKLMLQPFVENAILHAVWDDNHSLNIVIRLFREADGMIFEVVDDGAGMTAEQANNALQSHMDAGYGIRNVHERIQLAYGPGYGIELFSRRGIGTQVRIKLPLHAGMQ
ncbi:two-component sensor histidine kinase [Cohnella sp. CIP 111063]|uniref:cache domain-containing sensor histidine kinase n=1 Tax=unclassified Cohnella TaxID=2636738 RepID=UPI000B8C42CC|nr:MULTISPECIES: sensor histidine kinase [unclassified Cohnella]OXS55546.1 two-component sensor histidine kinase [Cohnella sp. CIP 111063]PRX66387.1 two-component system sensor histidine kinase YesM [Cohnella sp. SGD-V74]